MKVHSIFHVSLLGSCKESNILGRMQPPPLSIEVNNHEEYEVEKYKIHGIDEAHWNILYSNVDTISMSAYRNQQQMQSTHLKKYRNFINFIMINQSLDLS